MIRITHTRRQLAKATAATIATAALLAPAALANSASSSAYDPWFKNAIATQRSQPDPWFSNAVAKRQSQPDPWFSNAVAKQRGLATVTNPANQTGYRFITDTLDGNGQPATGYQFITDTLASGDDGPYHSVVPSSHGFNWADAGAGALGTLGLALLILTGRIVGLRKRGRLAF